MATDTTSRYRHLRPILKKYSGYFWFGALATFFANALILINPYLIKLAFEGVKAKQPS